MRRNALITQKKKKKQRLLLIIIISGGRFRDCFRPYTLLSRAKTYVGTRVINYNIMHFAAVKIVFRSHYRRVFS